ncbi:NAD-glutamate dehydrogenase [Galactobacter valiniphilus]|uniref:NAD-glutamate dehydrogenase n=1 Tax=Galactobacter valiniphilus TaxID=2676122 RepID=A0A399JEF8_9MICC|nr:NAD-glutamate dehydrogenase [Galactobacter valiniphilus]RII42559.1 NAD-glutamate dehydrogenase [Galactobacter valiniphilus]
MNDSGLGQSHPVQAIEVTDDLVGTYYRHLAPEDRAERDEAELRRRVHSHVALGATRPAGTARVGAHADGDYTVVQIVTDDMPFLVDSVTNAVLRHSKELTLVVHPTFIAHRALADGELLALNPVPSTRAVASGDTAALPKLDVAAAPAGGTAVIESWISVEISGSLDADAAAALLADVAAVLEDVRVAVNDWPEMRERARGLAEEIRSGSMPAEASDASEAAELLSWLDDGNFTFLGYREYALESPDGVDALRPVAGTGLGLLRRAGEESRPLTGLGLARAREKRALVLTTANRRSTVHRNTYLDYVGVKSFAADGSVTGERRFIGLFASSALMAPVRSVPVVRTKVERVLGDSGFAPNSHAGKDLLTILETYPRTELFQADEETIAATADGIMHLQERRRTRVFLRQDYYGRFVTALVFIPRDRYTTPVRLRVEEELGSAFNAVSMDYELRMSESALVRLAYRIRLSGEGTVANVDQAELEARLGRAVRSWSEGVSETFAARLDPAVARTESARWAEAFPADYRVGYEVEDALTDAERFDALGASEGIGLYLEPERGTGETRLKLYLEQAQPLSSILPVLHALGIDVRDERPYAVRPSDGGEFFLYDLGVRLPEGETEASAELQQLLADAYRAVAHGRAESDALQSLVTGLGFSWRQVAMLRAYSRYLRQLGVPTSPAFWAQTLLRYPAVACALVGLFEDSFDPSLPDEGRAAAVAERHAALEAGLEEVGTLDADRLIRRVTGLIDATLRTNYYQGHDRLAFKLATRTIEDAPLPRPAFEIWVYSPEVEGVHLRFGEVARGGLRWSDRGEDFRTEILGLVKAQTVKNAVIVPTGAKGGFFAKQLPDPAVDRGAWMEAGKAAYSEFIRSLLDVTDNLATEADGSESVVPPLDVVRRDADDTYLVVAADKGTASFSDLANSLAAERNFWLGDAFASGGSVGYDHKAMGITARGAWESVKRHFFELGVDVQTEDFTMVGIGDMSGDVFGNGLLRSRHTRLVAAFDHRHVFVDPTPNAEASFDERQRLFELPRSSWADYNPELISEGGGVFGRDAKSVPISAQMREALGLPESVQQLSPPELIQAVLKAPVDLLYNGGVGTYIKATDETAAEVGDRANDAIRIDGAQLRVKVIGEGGNLGMTQRGRIEAALGGVIVNTDAIDNSAGVDCSDHEVNIKILVDRLVRDGALAAADRADMLHSMTDDVAELVLKDNFDQNVLLLNEKQDPGQWGASQERLMGFLETHADLDRELEFLPSTEAFAKRLADGGRLTTPELAVIVAYAKIQLATALTASDLPDDPSLAPVLADYFPRQLRERFGEALQAHPLRREIIATVLANDAVNLGGASYVFRAMEETGASEADVVRAFLALRTIYRMDAYVDEVNALPASFGTEHWTRLHGDLRRLLDRTTRWFIEHDQVSGGVAASVERFQEPVGQLEARLPELLSGVDAARVQQWKETALEWGTGEDLAARWSRQFESFALLDIVSIAHRTQRPAEEVAGVYFAAYAGFGVDSLLDRITELPRTDRWKTLARAALRDDLYATVADLTAVVLEDEPEVGDPTERLAAWQEHNADRLERTQRSFAEVLGAGGNDMASLSVALRLLRSIVRR